MLPAALLMHLIHDHGATREDFASLRLCISGGDKVSGRTGKTSSPKLKAGFEIDEGYGMSETGLSARQPDPTGRSTRSARSARRTHGFHCEVRDDDGNEVAAAINPAGSGSAPRRP